MTPTDSSVTETGNDKLSELDIKKMNCLYHCDDCGGHQEGEEEISALLCKLFVLGDSGEIYLGWSDMMYDDGKKRTCNYLIRVEEGYSVQLIVEKFVRN